MLCKHEMSLALDQPEYFLKEKCVLLVHPHQSYCYILADPRGPDF